MVWDCACGSGQATAALAGRFALVIATDASAEQLTHAPALPHTIWQVAPAEASGLPDASVDVVAIAQALHWFDLSRFWPEVRRVVRPGGLIAAWSYGPQRVAEPRVDALLTDFYTSTVGPFWPAERRHVDSGYTTLAFPFERLAPPRFAMVQEWALPQMLGYVRSWSATQRYRTSEGRDPVLELEPRLSAAWGAGTHEVRWPLTVVAGTIGVD
ncbi:MAG: class I SAM-dependent methyltransferase [Gemmatimonadota bacterium]